MRREGVRVKRECEKGGCEGEEGVRREGVRKRECENRVVSVKWECEKRGCEDEEGV